MHTSFFANIMDYPVWQMHATESPKDTGI